MWVFVRVCVCMPPLPGLSPVRADLKLPNRKSVKPYSFHAVNSEEHHQSPTLTSNSPTSPPSLPLPLFVPLTLSFFLSLLLSHTLFVPLSLSLSLSLSPCFFLIHSFTCCFLSSLPALAVFAIFPLISLAFPPGISISFLSSLSLSNLSPSLVPSHSSLVSLRHTPSLRGLLSALSSLPYLETCSIPRGSFQSHQPIRRFATNLPANPASAHFLLRTDQSLQLS